MKFSNSQEYGGTTRRKFGKFKGRFSAQHLISPTFHHLTDVITKSPITMSFPRVQIYPEVTYVLEQIFELFIYSAFRSFKKKSSFFMNSHLIFTKGKELEAFLVVKNHRWICFPQILLSHECVIFSHKCHKLQMY